MSLTKQSRPSSYYVLVSTLKAFARVGAKSVRVPERTLPVLHSPPLAQAEVDWFLPCSLRLTRLRCIASWPRFWPPPGSGCAPSHPAAPNARTLPCTCPRRMQQSAGGRFSWLAFHATRPGRAPRTPTAPTVLWSWCLPTCSAGGVDEHGCFVTSWQRRLAFRCRAVHFLALICPKPQETTCLGRCSSPTSFTTTARITRSL